MEIAGTAANGDTLVAEKSDENGAVFALPEGELSYTIYAPAGATVSVNGVELDENYKKTGEDTTLSLFEGLENYGAAPEMEAWEVGGLHQTPEITAADESGTALSAPYLQDGVYVFQPAADEELPYMYGGTPLGTRLASEYSSRQPSGGVAAGSYDSVEVTGFVPYGDNLYTCTVLLYNDDELAGSCAVAFIKASGKWYAAATVEYAVE